MELFQRSLRALLVGLLGWAFLLPAAQAHLMVAQRGTLNIVNDGAFMVLSLPVLAFRGVDDDGDGRLSSAEFTAHRIAIADAVEANVTLSDAQGLRELQGLMLSLAPPDHEGAEEPSAQLVAMGRFDLADADAQTPLQFKVGLFGPAANEQVYRVNASRLNKSEQHLMALSPEQPAGVLFPSAWATFAGYVKLGALHIFEGPDHLLFLMVVLAAGWGWRHVLSALTLFTAGHFVTLYLSLKGLASVSPAIVEPAIAATIVGMAVFDMVARHRGHRPSRWLLLAVVFGCALIHGLGLGAALADFGLDNLHQLPSLAGFNVGIELAQLAVASVVSVVALGVQRWRGEAGLRLAAQAVGVAAMVVGTVWLMERLGSIS